MDVGAEVVSSRESSGSKAGSSESSSGRLSLGSSTRSVFGDRDSQDVGDPEVEQVREGSQGVRSEPDPGELWEGYNSEEFIRDVMDHSRFAINQERENKIDPSKLRRIVREYSIPESAGLRIPRPGELASNPEGHSAAFHPACLEIGVRLPLQPYLRRVLREIGVAPAQLNPNAWRILIGMYSLWRGMNLPPPTLAEIGHCYRLYSHRSGGDGWWALSCCDKRDGEPLITGLPSSNKEWKKTWFVAGGEWGKDLQLGGRHQRVRSVFNIPGVWDFLNFNGVFIFILFDCAQVLKFFPFLLPVLLPLSFPFCSSLGTRVLGGFIEGGEKAYIRRLPYIFGREARGFPPGRSEAAPARVYRHAFRGEERKSGEDLAEEE